MCQHFVRHETYQQAYLNYCYRSLENTQENVCETLCTKLQLSLKLPLITQVFDKVINADLQHPIMRQITMPAPICVQICTCKHLRSVGEQVTGMKGSEARQLAAGLLCVWRLKVHAYTHIHHIYTTYNHIYIRACLCECVRMWITSLCIAHIAVAHSLHTWNVTTTVVAAHLSECNTIHVVVVSLITLLPGQNNQAFCS